MTKSLTGSCALVTGGAGFIGSHLVQRLLDEGVARVVVVDSLSFGATLNLPPSDDRVALHVLDIGTSSVGDLMPAFSGVQFVFHLAAEKHNASIGNPNQMLLSNVQGTLNVLEASVQSGAEKVVFSSSLYAYGRVRGEPFQEEDRLQPCTVYAASKVCGEHLVRMYSSKIDTAILRYLFVYGPRQWANTGYKSVIVKNFERMLGGQAPVIFGDGSQALDYIYVDDAVDATIQSLRKAPNASVFNVGSGEAQDIASLTRLMIAIAEFKGVPKFEAPDCTAGTYRVADRSKLTRDLGWKPSVTIQEGLLRTYSWLKER